MKMILTISGVIHEYYESYMKPMRCAITSFLQVIYMTQNANYTGAENAFKFQMKGYNDPFVNAVLEA